MNLPERIKSRKLWIAVGTFIVFVANNQWTEAMGVVIAYLGLQGVQDTFGSGTSTPVVMDTSEPEDDIDTNVITTGNTPLFNEEVKDEE